MSENKRTRNLAEGEANNDYDEEGVGNYSKYTMLDEEVDEAEKEDIEDKDELEAVLYKFLNPYYFRRLRSDGKVRFAEIECGECKGINLGDDYWMKLHDAECHSKTNEPIKYKCLNENCTQVFDTRLERQKHSKEEYQVKFNVNNFIKHGISGNLYERFYDMYKTQTDNFMKKCSKIGNKYWVCNREDFDKETKAYYRAIIYTIDNACFDIVSTGAKLDFDKTKCNSCNNQFIMDHWYNLHYEENHKEEAPVKFGCFNELCDRKFDTLEERGFHCKEEHELKFDVDEYLKNGLRKEVFEKIKKSYTLRLKKEEDEQVEEIVHKMSDLMKPRSVIMKEKNDSK